MSPSPREAEPLARAPGGAGEGLRGRQEIPSGPAVCELLRQAGAYSCGFLGITLSLVILAAVLGLQRALGGAGGLRNSDPLQNRGIRKKQRCVFQAV